MIRKKSKSTLEIADWTKRKAGSLLTSLLRYVLLICLSYIILLPILKMISTAIKSPNELGSPVSVWVPGAFSLEHLTVAFKLLDYPKSLLYTLATTCLQVIFQTLSAALAGYSFARLKFKGSNLLFFGVILTIVVPQQVLMLPQYIYFRNFDLFGIIKATTGSQINLLNTPLVLYILAAFGMGLKSGLYIYIFRQFFRGLPKELEEAAYVDGCGFVKTLFRIVMPNASSAIITVTVLGFVWNWNDTYYTNLFSNSKSNLMLRLNSVAAEMDQGLQSISKMIPEDFVFLAKNPLYQSAILATSSLFIILPLLILYLILQKKFVENASRSGIVG